MRRIHLIGMSADPGFPNVSDERYRSLCNLIKRVEERIALTGVIVLEMEKDRSFKRETVKAAKIWRKRYERELTLVWLQFPEGRADRRGTYGPDDARENAEIIAEIKTIDQALADLAGVVPAIMSNWLNNGGSMPLLSKPPKQEPPK